jgi:hypothetical protein
MKSGVLVNAARWLLFIPASVVAANTAAWLFHWLLNLTYAFNIIQAPGAVEKNLYAVTTCAIFGWCFVAAGAATAPNRRLVVAGALFSILLTVLVYTVYQNNTWNTHGFLAFTWEAAGSIGYLAGAALAVTMAFFGARSHT